MVGDVEITSKTDGVERYLTTEETKESLENAAKAWIHAKKTISKKVGKGLYTLTAYERLKRVTVSLDDGFLLLANMKNSREENQTIDGILKQVHKDHV